jgi:hypothetical protein
MRSPRPFVLTAAAMLVALPAIAQQPANKPDSVAGTTTTSAPATARKFTRSEMVQETVLQNFRPQDQRGVGMFEEPKDSGVAYNGFKLSWGAAFTQQMQSIDHENTADSRIVGGVEQNRLVAIGTGFNTATANLNLGAQLAPGIRVALTTYLSSRHHNETWVKDGFLLVDQSPWANPLLDGLMEVLTIKAGHFEINYGDAHFRRSDNGNAMFNPFVGNMIVDAFTTQIGAEVLARKNGFLAMGGVTGGEIRGNVTRPDDRSLAFLGKVGYDSQVSENLRVRLTGSTFQQAQAISNTLYAGDRAGSRYYWVMENNAPTTTETGAFRSGMINPAFGSKVKAYMVNPFVKFAGLEVFGTLEMAEGRGRTETEMRDMNQKAIEGIYRFAADEQLYLGSRYNTVTGRLPGMAADVTTNRIQVGGGWFITPGVLMKAEWVTQKYLDFPSVDIRNGGKFSGFMVEGVVSF